MATEESINTKPMEVYPYLIPGRNYVLRISRDECVFHQTPNRLSVRLLGIVERFGEGGWAKIETSKGEQWYVRPYALYEK